MARLVYGLGFLDCGLRRNDEGSGRNDGGGAMTREVAAVTVGAQ